MIRACIVGAALAVAGIVLAAPAGAHGSCDEGGHEPCYQTNGPFWLNTPENYAMFPEKTVRNYANLPGDTIHGYQEAIAETIRQYTGIDITESHDEDDHESDADAPAAGSSDTSSDSDSSAP